MLTVKNSRKRDLAPFAASAMIAGKANPCCPPVFPMTAKGNRTARSKPRAQEPRRGRFRIFTFPCVQVPRERFVLMAHRFLHSTGCGPEAIVHHLRETPRTFFWQRIPGALLVRVVAKHKHHMPGAPPRR